MAVKEKTKRQTITRPQYFQACMYLKELGQETIDQRRLTQVMLAEEVSKAVGATITAKCIKNVLKDMGLKSAAPAEADRPQRKTIFTVNEMRQKIKTLDLALDTLAELRDRVDNLEKELGVVRQTSAIPPANGWFGNGKVARPHPAANGVG